MKINYPARLLSDVGCLVVLLACLPVFAASAASTTLIPTNSIWRYLADGSNQGVAWRAPGFDDSGWATGAAPLGYGLTGIATTQATGRVTYYYRRTFNVSSPGAYSNLIVRLRRDDGGIVYINNTEVFRSNMPTGAVGFATLATISATGTSQFTFFSNQVPTSVLVPGLNHIAVEIHQAGTNSVDAAFNLELTAIVDTTPPSVTLTNPANGATFIAGDNIAISATAGDSSGVALMEFYANGLLLSTATSAPYSATLSNARFGSYILTAVAQDAGGLRGTSSPVVINVTLHTNAVTLVANHAGWRYLDRGDDPSPHWMDRGFDDHQWNVGFAELGYGDGDEDTVIGFGTNANNKFITTYFRHEFNLSNPEMFTNLVLRLRRDDGAVVYLNGAEVFRDNLPSGLVLSSTLATNAVDDGAVFQTANINPAGILDAENVIAVEIHQTLATSSDISFDLQLLGVRGVVPPALSVSYSSASTVALAWPETAGASFVLQYQSTLNALGTWVSVAGLPVFSDGVWHYSETLGSANRYYRLYATEVESLSCQPPVVVDQPLRVSVVSGSNVSLTISAAGDSTLGYQWRRNEVFLEGQRSNTLTLTEVQRRDGGVYDAFVYNACGCTISCPILVTVDGESATLTDDFAERLITNSLSGKINASNLLATVEAGEPAHPVRVRGRTVWLGWTAPSNGVASFDTAGSGQETALVIYQGASLADLEVVTFAGPTGQERNSAVQFNAVAGKDYAIVADAAGLLPALNLNWTLTPTSICAPQIVVQPQTRVGLVGSNVTLTVVATSCATNVLKYQWWDETAAIVGATNASLLVSNLQLTNAHQYRVVVTANSGSITSTPASTIVVSASGSGGGGGGIGAANLVLNSGSIGIPTAEFKLSGKCTSVSSTGKRTVVDYSKLLVLCFKTTLTDPNLATCVGASANMSLLFPTALQTPPSGTKLTIDTFNASNAKFNSALKFSVQIDGAPCIDPSCVDTLTPSSQWTCTQLSSGTIDFTQTSCNTPSTYVLVTVFYNAITGNYGSTCVVPATAPPSIVINHSYKP